MEVFIILTTCILFGIGTAAIASGKGYPGFGFFLFGFCFPIIGLICALCLRDTNPAH